MTLNATDQPQKKHQKHAALKRPAIGSFGRNEWGIVGAPCNDIKALANALITVLVNDYKVAYVDALHQDEKDTPTLTADLDYLDCGGSQQVIIKGNQNPFQSRQLFSGHDLVLLNGNHHQSQQQIVVIDERKAASLQKRLPELTDVKLFLLAGEQTEVHQFLKTAIPNWQHIPVYSFNDVERIAAFIGKEMQAAKPVLNGLVLAGGKSERMGTDKGDIQWHGQPQRYYMASMLKRFCNEVYISCRDDQQEDIEPAYQTLVDTFTGLGPYGAILSAFRQQPDSAWLVVACDLPLLDKETLQELIDQRSVKHLATAFQSPDNNFPEPLITIWEPKSYPELLAFLAQGYSCPRKVLINSDTKIIVPANADALTNVNTPEERERVASILKIKTDLAI